MHEHMQDVLTSLIADELALTLPGKSKIEMPTGLKLRSIRTADLTPERCGHAAKASIALAAVVEIADAGAFWMSLRGATPLVAVVGVVSLVALAFALTRVDSG